MPADLSTDKLHDVMVSYYEAHVKVTEVSAKQIYAKAMGQSNGECEASWLEEQRNRITSSNVGQIAKRRSSTKVATKVKQLLYSTFHGNRATEWSLLQEDVSRAEYLKVKQAVSPHFTFEYSGLVVSVSNPWLAASPDGLVFDQLEDLLQGLVELKNPYEVRDITQQEAAATIKTFCLEINSDGKLQLKRGHDCYCQIQCALFCITRQWCNLVVLTKSLHIERIVADPNFKSIVLPKLRNFYFTAILPELASPQAGIIEQTKWVSEEWKKIYMSFDSGLQ